MNYFECFDCSRRTTSVEQLADCSVCSGQIQDIAVQQE
jgi:hypothetical protein